MKLTRLWYAMIAILLASLACGQGTTAPPATTTALPTLPTAMPTESPALAIARPSPGATLPSTAAPTASPTVLRPTPTPASRPTPVVTAPYLMAFLACDTAAGDCHDPRNHLVYLAQGDDGLHWSLIPDWRPYPGSVPDVIRRGDTLYLYTPGQLARYHLDTNTLDPPIPVDIPGLPAGFVDPSLFVDEQGRLVLFFLYGQPGSDPAGCAPGETTCVRQIGSATEVGGSDGAAFTLDAGQRVSMTVDPQSAIKTASDPDIFFDGKRYVLYLSHGASTSVWVSDELRGAYVQEASLPQGLLTLGTGGVPAGYFDSLSDQYWTFAHANQNGLLVIRRAVHADLSRQLSESGFTTVISGESLGLGATYNVGSPGFTVNIAGGSAPPKEQPAAPSRGHCGDGVCDGPENVQNCPQDCGAPTPAPTFPADDDRAAAQPIPPIYVTVAGHIEDVPVYANCSAYPDFREKLLLFAEKIAPTGAAVNLQIEYEFFVGASRCETEAMKASTNGQNVIDYLATHYNFEIDAHQEGGWEEGQDNYADIRYLGGLVTPSISEVVGGLVWGDPAQFERLAQGEPGQVYPDFTWFPEVLTLAVSRKHHLGDFSQDDVASRVWFELTE